MNRSLSWAVTAIAAAATDYRPESDPIIRAGTSANGTLTVTITSTGCGGGREN